MGLEWNHGRKGGARRMRVDSWIEGKGGGVRGVMERKGEEWG